MTPTPRTDELSPSLILGEQPPSIDDIAPGWEAFHADHMSTRNGGARKGGIVAEVRRVDGRVRVMVFEPFHTYNKARSRAEQPEWHVSYDTHDWWLTECDPDSLRPLRLTEANTAAKTFCAAIIANTKAWTQHDEAAFCLAAVLTEGYRELAGAERSRIDAARDERASECEATGLHCVARLSEAHSRRGHIGVCCDCSERLPDGFGEAARGAAAKRPAWAESL